MILKKEEGGLGFSIREGSELGKQVGPDPDMTVYPLVYLSTVHVFTYLQDFDF